MAETWTKFEYRLLGDGVGPTIFFLHGWPDVSESLFARFITDFVAQGYRVCTLTLPGFGPKTAPHFGFPMAKICDLMNATVKEVMSTAPEREKRCALVAHDWGSHVAHMYVCKFPTAMNALVALDVAHDWNGKELVKAGFLYQWALLSLMFVPRMFADAACRRIARRVGSPEPHRATSSRSYLYLRLWLHLLSRGRIDPWFSSKAVQRGGATGADRKRKRVFPAELRIPILFLHSSRNPIKFFTQNYLDALRETHSLSEAHKVEGDHWFPMRSKTAPETIDRARVFLRSAL